ncbi:MAG: hypothetical protein ABW185_13975, partial [Sedimenticola sp.]
TSQIYNTILLCHPGLDNNVTSTKIAAKGSKYGAPRKQSQSVMYSEFYWFKGCLKSEVIYRCVNRGKMCRRKV